MLDELRTLALDAKREGYATAFGEIGLDYDRLFLSPKEPQLKYFEAQLDIAVEVQLPLFLHSRAAAEDFERLLTPRLAKLPKRGLVHSFTGTLEEMRRLVDLGLDIGVNGCSLKLQENLDVVKEIPLDRLQLETDGPWVCLASSFPVMILAMTLSFLPIVCKHLLLGDSRLTNNCPIVRDPSISRILQIHSGGPSAAKGRQKREMD